MSDLKVSEHTKISGTAEFEALASVRTAQLVWLWDAGPEAPKLPERPKTPKGDEGDPEHDLAMIEFREQIADYESGLRTYRQKKTEYDAWQQRFGGPYEFSQLSPDAQETFWNDERAVKEGRQSELRYFLSARTRGQSRLKNAGLPKDLKPGPRHAENLQREIEGNADLAAAMRRDPVFGNQEASQ